MDHPLQSYNSPVHVRPEVVDALSERDAHVVAQQLQRDHVQDALQRPVRHRHAHRRELAAVNVAVICGRDRE